MMEGMSYEPDSQNQRIMFGLPDHLFDNADDNNYAKNIDCNEQEDGKADHRVALRIKKEERFTKRMDETVDESLKKIRETFQCLLLMVPKHIHFKRIRLNTYMKL